MERSRARRAGRRSAIDRRGVRPGTDPERYRAVLMRRLAVGSVIALLVGGRPVLVGAGAATAPSLRLTRVADLANVTAMAARPGTRTLYVTEQEGSCAAIRDGRLSSTPVLDLSDRVSRTAASRASSGSRSRPTATHLYVDYTDTNGDTPDRRVHDERAPQRRPVDPAHDPHRRRSRSPTTTAASWRSDPTADLYIGLGDGGGAGDDGAGSRAGRQRAVARHAARQDPAHRPEPGRGGAPYTVPDDNPFVGRDDARPEIWSYGLRNPWRFSFDRDTGDLWIGDVGQNEWEEIDRVDATGGRDAGKGLNFGWNRLEGTHEFRGDAPVGGGRARLEVRARRRSCSVTGGYVYRGTKIPALARQLPVHRLLRRRDPRPGPRRRWRRRPWRTTGARGDDGVGFGQATVASSTSCR